MNPFAFCQQQLLRFLKKYRILCREPITIFQSSPTHSKKIGKNGGIEYNRLYLKFEKKLLFRGVYHG
jgi:hypothetical protein